MLSLRGPVSVQLLLADEHTEFLGCDKWAVIIGKLGSFVNEFKVHGLGSLSLVQVQEILRHLDDSKKYYHLYIEEPLKDCEQYFRILRSMAYFGSLIVSYPAHNQQLWESVQAKSTHQEVADFISQAVSVGIEVNVTTTVYGPNSASLEDIAESAFALGANYAIFARYVGKPAVPLAPSEGQLHTALGSFAEMRLVGCDVSLDGCWPNCFQNTESRGCLGAVVSGAVNARGELIPCSCCHDMVGYSLLENEVTPAWRSPQMEAWRNDIPSVCEHCARLSYCPGGCRTCAEMAGVDKDPLIRKPITSEAPVLREVTLEEELCPTPCYVVREEDFGWALIRANQVIPVSYKAGPVLKLFDGHTTLAQIERQLGAAALSFVYSLYVRGFVEFAEGAAEESL